MITIFNKKVDVKILFFVWLILYMSTAFAAETDSTTSYHIKIEGEINLGLPNYLSRIIKEANAKQAGAVILEINTPGGRVDAALEIRDAIFDS